MKKATNAINLFIVLTILFTSCDSQKADSSKEVSTPDATSKMPDEKALIEKNLAKFDTLDFNVFSKRDWARFHESHAEDVIVHFPDGHTTNGLKKHIEDMEAMFVYAPDTRITSHPVKVGQGNITAVTGWMEGTFTEPMPDGKGGFIPPTGKKFKLPMSTFSIWKEDGTMSEEYLYWDNQSYMNQLGLGK